MKKPAEKFPLQFFVQHRGVPPLDESTDDETHGESLSLTTESAADLQSTYQALWALLSEVAKRSKADPVTHGFSTRHLFESHAIQGHPDVYLQCRVVDEKWLALVIETKVKSQHFSGQVGLVVGGRGQGKQALLHAMHAHPLLELDLTSSPRLSHVYSNTFEPHAEALLAGMVAKPGEISAIQQWIHETEKVVTVPEESLRDTSKWLSKVNYEIATERAASRLSADEQNQEFMRLFTTLANPRMEA